MKKGYIAIHDADHRPPGENPRDEEEGGIASILVGTGHGQGQGHRGAGPVYGKTGDFSEHEIEFLTALAEQGGMAIERSRLIEQISKNINIFHDLAQRFNSSLDINTILDTLSQDLAHALGIKAVSGRLLDKEKRRSDS